MAIKKYNPTSPARRFMTCLLYTSGDMCDGVFNYVHPFGCSQLGDDQKMTQNVLKGLVNHPNATGVLVLGLGCENNNISVFKTVLGEVDENRVKFMRCV